MMDTRQIQYALLGMIACVLLVVAYVVSKNREFLALFQVPFIKYFAATQSKEPCLLSVYVEQYQGEGKPTLVRLISGQRSLDTRMWQSSVKLKLSDFLTIELFEDSTFGTFGPRFMGRATLSRKEIETSWDPEACKPQEWIQILKGGHTIGSLKLEMHIIKNATISFSSGEENAVKETTPLFEKVDNADLLSGEDLGEDLENELNEADEQQDDEDSIEPPPGADEFWEQPQTNEEPEAFMPGDTTYEADEAEPKAESFCGDMDAPPGYDEFAQSSLAVPEFRRESSFFETGSEFPLDPDDYQGYIDSEGNTIEPEKYRLTTSMPKLGLVFLAESLEGPLCKIADKRKASKFIKGWQWQQRYFKMYQREEDDEWVFGRWRTKEDMDANAPVQKIIEARCMKEIKNARSHSDRFAIEYLLEDGSKKECYLRTAGGKSRQEWVEHLRAFIQEIETLTCEETEL